MPSKDSVWQEWRQTSKVMRIVRDAGYGRTRLYRLLAEHQLTLANEMTADAKRDIEEAFGKPAAVVEEAKSEK